MLRRRYLRATAVLFALLAAGAAFEPSVSPPLSAQAAPGTIAFARLNDQTGNEIWLIAPDGSNQHRIWSSGVPIPAAIDQFIDLDWRPDAGELAFASNHEHVGDATCSLFDSDLYTVRPDGSGYRRISNAPACAGLTGYVRGTVTVQVRNFSTRNPLFVYVQGAPKVTSVMVSQGSSATVTIPDVADFGAGFMQQAVVIWGDGRWLAPLALADVIPGQTVHAGRIDVAGAPAENFGAYAPSWHSDGARLGYILTSAGAMYGLPGNPGAGAYGEALLNMGAANPPSADVMDWGPASLANQILFASHLNSGIFRVTEGSTTLGTKLVETGIDTVFDLQWLPDGSGFVYTRDGDFRANANVYRYDFATGKATQLTQFSNAFAIDVSPSPDGQWIAFERSGDNDLRSGDLWIMRRDGTELRLLVNDGVRPSWSPRALPAQSPPPAPSMLPHRSAIPFVMR